jgi:hypothetical protein
VLFRKTRVFTSQILSHSYFYILVVSAVENVGLDEIQVADFCIKTYFRRDTESEAGWFHLTNECRKCERPRIGGEDILDAVQLKARVNVRIIPMWIGIQQTKICRLYIMRGLNFYRWRKATAVVYNLSNACNQGYKLCLIFCSRMRLYLHMLVSAKKGIFFWEQQISHGYY